MRACRKCGAEFGGRRCPPCQRANVRRPGPRYRQAVRSARARGISWGLSFEEFAAHLDSPCHYCGGVIDTTGSGYDRLDSSCGYVRDNVVSCCRVCNTAKQGTLTYQEAKMLAPILQQIRLQRGGIW